MKPNDPKPSDTAPEPPQGVKPRLLKIQATATLLGVSPDTIERLHAAAKMPAPIRLCRDLLWDAEELNAWIDQARKNGGTPPARREWVALYEVLRKANRN